MLPFPDVYWFNHITHAEMLFHGWRSEPANLTNTKFNSAKIRNTKFKDAILTGSSLEKKLTQSKTE